MVISSLRAGALVCPRARATGRSHQTPAKPAITTIRDVAIRLFAIGLVFRSCLGFDVVPTCFQGPRFVPHYHRNGVDLQKKVSTTIGHHSSQVLYLYSEVMMLAIRLPQSIEKRLEKLARRTGRTKTFYVREALLEHLEDLEDMYLAEGALERIRTGDARTIPLKEVMKRHGLER
jgi:RHH-type rel operon transcriptional repressor/antitoxin RelB